MNLTILVGPPGSGKSTYAKQLESQGYVRVSQDDQGKSGCMDVFTAAIHAKQNIVIDRMNFDIKQRERFTIPSKMAGYTVNFVEFCVPRQVCFDRCIARLGHPTITEEKHALSALETYFRFYEPVTKAEGELSFQSYIAPKTTAIMVDLDGTLANLNHRLHYVRREGKKDWNMFFKECGKDALYECVASVVRAEQETGTKIVFCSGRTDDQCRELTQEWLDLHGFEGFPLIMRPKLNYKDDAITKIMLYKYEIEPYYNVKYVLDDRDRVVEAWRKLGLVCFQVRPGSF